MLAGCPTRYIPRERASARVKPRKRRGRSPRCFRGSLQVEPEQPSGCCSASDNSSRLASAIISCPHSTGNCIRHDLFVHIVNSLSTDLCKMRIKSTAEVLYDLVLKCLNCHFKSIQICKRKNTILQTAYKDNNFILIKVRAKIMVCVSCNIQSMQS